MSLPVTNFYISRARLLPLHPCSWRLQQFTDTFGTGQVFLTARNVHAALRDGLDLQWLVWQMRNEIAELRGIAKYTDKWYRFYEKDYDSVRFAQNRSAPGLRTEHTMKVFKILVKMSVELRKLKINARQRSQQRAR